MESNAKSRTTGKVDSIENPKAVKYLWSLIPLGVIGAVLTLALFLWIYRGVSSANRHADQVDQQIISGMAEINLKVEHIKSDFRQIFTDTSRDLLKDEYLTNTDEVFEDLDRLITISLDDSDKSIRLDTVELSKLSQQSIGWRRTYESIREQQDLAWQTTIDAIAELRAKLDSHEGRGRISMILAANKLRDSSQSISSSAIEDLLAASRTGSKLSMLKTELSDLLFSCSKIYSGNRPEVLSNALQNEIQPTIQRLQSQIEQLGAENYGYQEDLELIINSIFGEQNTQVDQAALDYAWVFADDGLVQVSTACLQSRENGDFLERQSTIAIEVLEESIRDHAQNAMVVRGEAAELASSMLRVGMITIVTFASIIGAAYVVLIYKVASYIHGFLRDLRQSHQDIQLANMQATIINQELEASMDERADLQMQLMEAQKLESIGQLAAGIAHEINTPAQYVSDNTRFLQTEFAGIIRVLDSYAGLINRDGENQTWDERYEEIQSTLDDVDFDFIREEIPQAIEQSIEGVERITKIIKAMKDFSHPGTEQKEQADLNAAIQSTAVVCSNRWKYAADVEFELDQNIDTVPCYLAEFNQVILNLIVNAADAIESNRAEQGTKGLILIRTKLLKDRVRVSVSDNGGGMPESVRLKVFDPFFTTKGVGKGTGQGLSISRDVIVGKHGGTIVCETREHVGTEFIIELPLQEDAAISIEHEKEAA